MSNKAKNEVTKIENNEVAVVSSSGMTNVAGMEIALPEVKLIGKTGRLSSDFSDNLGEFVYDEEEILGKEVNIILVGYQPSYEEVIEFEPGVFPKTFATLNDAAKEGYSDDYHAELKVKPVGAIEFLIEVHADSDLADYAPIEIDGNAYVPTKMKIVSKTSFDGVCAVIDSLRIGALSKGLHTRRLKLEAKLVKGKSNSWFGAKLSLVKPDGKLSDEVKGEIEALFPTLKG